MRTYSELRLALEEAVVAADAAIAAAESLATHGILPSHDFERLMSSLQEVQTSLDRAKDKASPKLMIVK